MPGRRRSFTLTAAQSRAAGARLGSGRHLFFRIIAVRQGRADTQARPYGHLQHATIAGRGPATNGEELVPSMWDGRAGGIGLQAALRQNGMGNYALTRDTPHADASPGDVRILYDPSQVSMVSKCSPDNVSCAIRLPDRGPLHVAAYAKFRDVATGQEFWFVTAHLNHGSNAAPDKLRGRQAHAIVAKVNKLNAANLPVIVTGDFNSSQTSAGHDAPHQALLRRLPRHHRRRRAGEPGVQLRQRPRR